VNYIIVRADDLGYSEAVNYGIEKTVKEGIVNNVGVMVNMEATDHGVQLVKHEDIDFSCHVNICLGKPISDSDKIPSIVDKNGEFKRSSVYRNSQEDFVDYEEVFMEVEAQYNRFLELMGKKPDYFEGHAVSTPHFNKALKAVADKYDLIYSEIPEKNQPAVIRGNKVYYHMDSGLPDYDPFETITHMIEYKHEDGIDLLILHPGYLDEILLKHSSLTLPRVKEVTFATSDKTKKIIEDNEINLLRYSDLAHKIHGN